jgi:hypothetical protein
LKSFYRLQLPILLFFLINFSGCLTTEYKEYLIKINPDGSGEGEIIFYNIVSAEDDEKDVSFKDFGELVSDYMEGSRFEDDNPSYHVINKELSEFENTLVGKVKFTFNDFRKIGFFKAEDCECSPVMFYMGDFGETYLESNGKYYGDENFPVIVWSSDAVEMRIKTVVQEDLSKSYSLLDLYKTWQKDK